MQPFVSSQPHLSLHAADAHQLIQDQQGPMHTVISVHPLLLGQGLIEAFLSLFKGLLQQRRGTNN